jgi:hypothetical protein
MKQPWKFLDDVFGIALGGASVVVTVVAVVAMIGRCGGVW